MLKELEDLLHEIIHFQESEDVDYDLFNKVKNEEKLIPGNKIEIWWTDRDEADNGYLFRLPHQQADEYDLCVHVTDVDNSDGMDDAPEEFHHIYHLVSLKRVKKINIK